MGAFLRAPHLLVWCAFFLAVAHLTSSVEEHQKAHYFTAIQGNTHAHMGYSIDVDSTGTHTICGGDGVVWAGKNTHRIGEHVDGQTLAISLRDNVHFGPGLLATLTNGVYMVVGGGQTALVLAFRDGYAVDAGGMWTWNGAKMSAFALGHHTLAAVGTTPALSFVSFHVRQGVGWRQVAAFRAHSGSDVVAIAPNDHFAFLASVSNKRLVIFTNSPLWNQAFADGLPTLDVIPRVATIGPATVFRGNAGHIVAFADSHGSGQVSIYFFDSNAIAATTKVGSKMMQPLCSYVLSEPFATASDRFGEAMYITSEDLFVSAPGVPGVFGISLRDMLTDGGASCGSLRLIFSGIPTGQTLFPGNYLAYNVREHQMYLGLANITNQPGTSSGRIYYYVYCPRDFYVHKPVGSADRICKACPTGMVNDDNDGQCDHAASTEQSTTTTKSPPVAATRASATTTTTTTVAPSTSTMPASPKIFSTTRYQGPSMILTTTKQPGGTTTSTATVPATPVPTTTTKAVTQAPTTTTTTITTTFAAATQGATTTGMTTVPAALVPTTTTKAITHAPTTTTTTLAAIQGATSTPVSRYTPAEVQTSTVGFISTATVGPIETVTVIKQELVVTGITKEEVLRGQNRFETAIAKTLGVSSSRVSVTNITANPSRRRRLSATLSIYYTVQCGSSKNDTISVLKEKMKPGKYFTTTLQYRVSQALSIPEQNLSIVANEPTVVRFAIPKRPSTTVTEGPVPNLHTPSPTSVAPLSMTSTKSLDPGYMETTTRNMATATTTTETFDLGSMTTISVTVPIEYFNSSKGVGHVEVLTVVGTAINENSAVGSDPTRADHSRQEKVNITDIILVFFGIGLITTVVYAAFFNVCKQRYLRKKGLLEVEGNLRSGEYKARDTALGLELTEIEIDPLVPDDEELSSPLLVEEDASRVCSSDNSSSENSVSEEESASEEEESVSEEEESVSEEEESVSEEEESVSVSAHESASKHENQGVHENAVIASSVGESEGIHETAVIAFTLGENEEPRNASQVPESCEESNAAVGRNRGSHGLEQAPSTEIYDTIEEGGVSPVENEELDLFLENPFEEENEKVHESAEEN